MLRGAAHTLWAEAVPIIFSQLAGIIASAMVVFAHHMGISYPGWLGEVPVGVFSVVHLVIAVLCSAWISAFWYVALVRAFSLPRARFIWFMFTITVCVAMCIHLDLSGILDDVFWYVV